MKLSTKTLFRILLIIVLAIPCLIVAGILAIPSVYIKYIVRYTNDFVDVIHEKLEELGEN